MTSLVEQIQLIAADARCEAQALLMWAALAGLAALLSYACCRFALKYLCRYIDATGRLGRVGQLLAVLATFALVLFGGEKTGYSFSFFAYSGVYDCGSYVDFDTGEITAVWGFEPQVAAYEFKWSYTYVDENDVHHGPFNLPPVLVTARTATEYVDEIKTAKRVEISCYTAYVRPPAVHTNGVHDVSGGHSLTNNLGYVFPEIVIYADLDDGSSETLTPTNAPPVPQSSLLENLYQEINQ